MIQAKTAVAQAILGSEQNLLILRSLLFAIFPLVAATTLVRRRALPLDRTTLRGPFFAQCYLAAPFALRRIGRRERSCASRTTRRSTPASPCSLSDRPGTSASRRRGSRATWSSAAAGRLGVALGSFLRAALYSSLLGASLILVVV